MYRGTTPTLTFRLPIDTGSITALSLAVAQGGVVRIEKGEGNNIRSRAFERKKTVKTNLRVPVMDVVCLQSFESVFVDAAVFEVEFAPEQPDVSIEKVFVKG